MQSPRQCCDRVREDELPAENNTDLCQRVREDESSSHKCNNLCRISECSEPLVHALLEALRLQHLLLEDAHAELEAERSASATSIDDAMLMITRLQEEKARLAMEAAQFRREAEEKISHAQKTLSAYEDLLFRKDEELEALRCEIQALKRRSESYGIRDEMASCDGDGYVRADRTSYARPGGYERRSNDSSSLGFSYYEETIRGDQGEKGCTQQIDVIERTRNFPETSFSGHNLLLWERIEGLQKRLHLLSDKKTVSCDMKDEWGSSFEELQSALASYITSLRKGLRAHWQDYFSDVHEAAQNRNQNNKPVDVFMDTKQMGAQHQKTVSLSQTYEKGGFTQVSIGEPNILELMDSKIKDLSIRVHALEDDGKSVNQAINSLRRQQYSVKYLKQIVHGLRKSKELSKGQILVKMLSPQKVVSLASLIKYFLSQLPVGVRGILSFILFRTYKHAQRR